VDLEGYRKLFPSQDWTVLSKADQENAVFIGRRLAERLRVEKERNITLRISDRQFHLPVGGFVESGEAEDDQLFVAHNFAEKMNLGASGYHSILISVLGEMQQVETEVSALVEDAPGTRFQIIRKIAAAETTILNRISRLMGLIILLIFVILFFCIHTTVSTILLSRQSEIALLRVLGAKRKQITAILTSELLLLGIVGGISGYLVGLMMAQVLGKVLFQSYILPNFVVFAVTILFSLFLMLISSLLPISRAVNRQAATVLKEA
jgi:putative ABC transport system permease protein